MARLQSLLFGKGRDRSLSSTEVISQLQLKEEPNAKENLTLVDMIESRYFCSLYLLEEVSVSPFLRTLFLGTWILPADNETFFFFFIVQFS